ncbi:MAG: hypothetical protein KGI71_04675 [Patescibacteria group bacterium]|nr:hypothetical protein [Patescibacteria group bacterium]
MSVTDLGGGEKPAFEKLYQGLRHAQEAAVEIAQYSGDRRWNLVAIGLAKMLAYAIKMGGRTSSRLILPGRH